MGVEFLARIKKILAKPEDKAAGKQDAGLDGEFYGGYLASRLTGLSPERILAPFHRWNNAAPDRNIVQYMIEVRWERPEMGPLFLGDRQIGDEPSIGLIEFSSISLGMKTCDQMLKSSPVELLEATTVCPGKFVVVVYGDAVTVDYAMIKGRSVGEEWIADSLFIPNIDRQVVAALSGHPVPADYDSLGVIETRSVASGIIAADTMTKLTAVQLQRIKLAKEIGGKAYIIVGGTLGEVEDCLEKAKEVIGSGNFIQAATIPVPDEALLRKMGLPLPNSQNVFV